MEKAPATYELMARLLDNQPDAVVWLSPVFENNISGAITDFEVQYCNRNAARLSGIGSKQLVGTCIRQLSLRNEVVALPVFEQCLQTWNSGRLQEDTIYSSTHDRYFQVQCSKVEDGVLAITRDRSHNVKAEIERQEQEKNFQQILDTSADGIMLLKSIRNDQGEIVDFLLAHCNQKGLETGRFPPDAVGKPILQLLPHLKQSDQLQLHRTVVETGLPQRFETTFHTPEGNEYGWFIVSLTKLGDGVISTFVDVTEKKAFEQQLLEQKLLLNNILDSSLNAVYTCEAVRDPSGTIVDFRFIQFNQRFREQMADPNQDIVGKKLLEEFPAAKQTAMLPKLTQVVETGEPVRFEVCYQKEGFPAWYDTSAVKLGENDVVVTFANITEQKRTLLELERQKNLLDNILRHSANGISVTKVFRNPEGKVVDGRAILANNAAVNFAGIPRELYFGKTAVELDPHLIDSPYYQLCIKTLETGEPQFTQYFLDFSKRWLEISISRLDENHIITIFTDVTPAKETQLQLERSLQELQRSNESLEEFTRAASHDLKEPIRKVQFFADRLKQRLESTLTEEEKGMMERMENAAARMKLLVDDLLSYSHVSQQATAKEEVDLNKKMRLVLTDLELPVTEKGAVINVGPLPVVNGYRRQLQQLFYNLLSNAIKYHKPGVPPEITVTSDQTTGATSGIQVVAADAEKAFHLLQFRDNGIGFDQEYADKIFNVFTRLHGNHEYTGTGVGLAIVRKVVENHQGYISAESTPGHGATFRVLLPA